VNFFPNQQPGPHLSRRKFLRRAGAAGAIVALGQANWPLARAASDSKPAAPSWIEKPMRWAQLTLVEDDPGKFEDTLWLDYL